MDTNDLDIAALQTSIDQYLEFLRTIGPDEPQPILQKAFLAKKYLLSAREKARSSRVGFPDFSHNELVAINQAILSTLEDTADELDGMPLTDPRRDALTLLRSCCDKWLRFLLEKHPDACAE